MTRFKKCSIGLGRKLLVLMAMGLLMSLLPAGKVSAGEIVGHLYQAEKPMTAYADKDTSSAVVHEFATGDPMMLVQEDDNWYQIYWGSDMAYIPKNGAAAAAVDTKIEDIAPEDGEIAEGENAAEAEPEEAPVKEEPAATETTIKPLELPELEGDGEGDVLEQEAERNQEEFMEQQAAYEAEQAAKKKALIWRIIMVILVIAIIAVSLVPAIINTMREKKKKEAQTLREEASKELTDLEEEIGEETERSGGEDDTEAEPEEVSGDEGDDGK